MAIQVTTSNLLAASEIKGTDVTNLQNEGIGDVQELLLEPNRGTVRFLVLSVGGFIGLGSTRVAVPWQAFNMTTQRDGSVNLRLDASKERLEKAPRIEGNNYERLYTAAGAAPVIGYWETA